METLKKTIKYGPKKGQEVWSSISYGPLVSRLIRERYSMDAEMAILRQRDTKQDEFAEYFTYCEACKAKAKVLIAEREQALGK